MQLLAWFPQTKNTCGQTCAAMLAGRPLSEVAELSGRPGGTTTRQMAALFRRLGFRCGDKLITIRPTQPCYYAHKTALLKLKTEGRKSGWHWVLYHDERFYDPAPDIGCPLDPLQFDEVLRYRRDRVTSYLPIEMPS